MIVALALGLLAAHPARATEPFAKTRYSATFAGLSRGVRNIGMGSTGAADVSGSSTGYFNPAGLAWMQGVTTLGSWENWPLDMDLVDVRVSSSFPLHADSAAGAWRFGASLGHARLMMHPQEVRTIFLPEGTGQTIDDDDWLLSGSAAAAWTRGALSAGAGGTAKYIHQDFANGDQWSFDLGVIAAFPVEIDGGRLRPRAGFATLNLDTGDRQANGAEVVVATEYRVGLGLDAELPPVSFGGRFVPAMAVSIDYDWIDREGPSSIDYGFGTEVSFAGMLHARIGAVGDAYSTYGVGLGWDYGTWLFRIDYAKVSPKNITSEPELFDLDRDSFGGMVGVRW